MPEKVLVIAPNWIGDLVISQVLLKKLKQNNKHITVCAPKYCQDLLQRMPEVDEILSSPAQHGKLNFKNLLKFSKKIKIFKFDRAIILPNSFKSALIPFFAKIPQRTGYLGEMRYLLLTDIKKLDKKLCPTMAMRFAALSGNLNYSNPNLLINKNNLQNLNLKFNINQNKKILVLAPGAAFGDAKCWPAEYFATVADKKFKENWQIIILGSQKDKVIAERINNLAHNCCNNLCGKTSIADTVDLISQTNAVVSNDSGLMHISAAVNVPLIAIYGASSPKFTPPLSEAAIILEDKNLSCRPCFKRTCPLEHKNCLYNITPTILLERLEQIIM